MQSNCRNNFRVVIILFLFLFVITVAWRLCQIGVKTVQKHDSDQTGYSFLYDDMEEMDKNYNQVRNVNEMERKTIAIGIVSQTEHVCQRDSQRKTFLSKARTYKPLTIQVFFLLDFPTPELEEERRVNQDILYLNTTVQGYLQGFAMKIHRWIRYVVANFPDTILIGKMDDDVFACTPQVFDRLNQVKHEMLYYGYPTGKLDNSDIDDVLDEMFLFIGIKLAHRLAKRSMCSGNNVVGDCLIDGNGGPAVRYWLTQYDDYIPVDEKANDLMVWFYRDTPNGYALFSKARTYDFCERYLLYHKASVTDVYRMNQNNRLILGDTSWTNLTEKEILAASNCLNYTERHYKHHF